MIPFLSLAGVAASSACTSFSNIMADIKIDRQFYFVTSFFEDPETAEDVAGMVPYAWQPVFDCEDDAKEWAEKFEDSVVYSHTIKFVVAYQLQ